jgi:hypothetical protein
MNNNRIAYIVLILFCLNTANTLSQGILSFSNSNQPGNGTVIGQIDGPKAGSNYLAQLLVGLNADSLSPVGTPVSYLGQGLFFGGIITVPNVNGGVLVRYQAHSWDGSKYGNDINNVPVNLIGKSDIGVLTLASGLDAIPSTVFESATVIPVPEPITPMLFMVAIVSITVWNRRRNVSKES